MANILITGSGSGLGALLFRILAEEGHDVFGWDKDRWPNLDVRDPDPVFLPPELDVLINCAGINKIGWLDEFPAGAWDEVMDTNAKGIFMMAKACAPLLRKSRGTILNIVSNAAHTPMRCSAAYNASKGAALILTKQLARELASDGITVFSVSPNKLAGTGMSNDIDEQVMKTRGWTREEAQKYQLAGLLTGEETDPLTLAEFIAFLLSSKQRHKYLAGCDIAYGL